MGDTLRGGTRENFANTLASYIEDAMEDVRDEYDLDPLPSEGRDDRRMLFLGIARGFVTYLGDNEQAFVIDSHHDLGSTEAFRHDDTLNGFFQINVDVASGGP